MSTLIFVRFFPKRGMESQVESILRIMVTHTRREPGCRRYDLYETQGNAGEKMFCLIECYADAAAQQMHRQTDHYVEYRANIADRLDKAIEVSVLQSLDVA